MAWDGYGVDDGQGVELRYLGHSSFLWSAVRGVRVLIDPYHQSHLSWNWRWFLAAFPAVEADIVLVTHDHFDHNATEEVSGGPEVISSAERKKFDGVSIVGIEDVHASPDNMPNHIFVVEAGGIRFCHLGDNRPDLPRSVVEAIGDVDVLFVPADGSSHLLRFWEVNQLIETFKPRVVVPMHYLIPGLTDPASTLLPVDEWLKTQPQVRRLDTDRLDLNDADLPDEREVWVFEPKSFSA